jgi:predicted Zn-dependent protease
LVTAELFPEAKPLLEYALGAPGAPQARLDLAIAIFHLQGARAGLAELDRVPSGERNGNYFLARSQLFDAAGKPDDALSAVRQALQAGPTRVDLYQASALFLTRSHHADDAIALLERAEKTLAPDPRIELLKAGALAASSHADRAESTLKDTERRWPEWAPAYVTYGILLEGQKRAEEAKVQLENAAALGASGSELFLYLARATLDAAPDQVDAAHQAIAQALALAPNDPWIQGTAGRIDYARKDYQAAIDHLTAAVHLRPNYLQARFTLAQAYRAVGRKDEAARESAEFQRLRAENPGGADELPPQ